MTDLNHLCLGCMSEIGTADFCERCGWRRGEKQEAPFLQQKLDVGGRYLIGRHLRAGGDGNTYLAWDLDADRPVYLREFFPGAIASREAGDPTLRVMSGCEKVFADCKDAFLGLWNKIVKLNGLSSLISAKEIIRDYGTLYVVIENNGYRQLDDYLNTLPCRRMTWEALRTALMPLLSTIATLHAAGIIHGGIAPHSILVSPEGRFYIGGFSIIQARCSVGDLNAELFSGYSAAEQYGARQKLGTWSDVYALAAVIYRCLTGADPKASSQRLVHDDLMIPGDIAAALPPHVLNAVINALQTKPENRTVDVEEMRAELLGQTVKKHKYPLSYYNYNDISYVNQDKKPYVAQTEYFTSGNGIPKPVDRGGANVSRSYEPVNEKKDSSGAHTPSSSEEPNNGKSKGVAAFILVISMLAVGAIAYFMFFSDSFPFSKEPLTTVTTTQATYSVPNFSGRTDVSLKADAALRSQFKLIYQQEYSAEAAEGYVVSQNIAPGTVVPAGSEIIIVISLGPKALVVPNVIGIEAEAAKAQLTEMGYLVKITEKANDGSQKQGYVGSIVPDVGTNNQQGDTVYLHVWGAPPTTTTTSLFSSGGSSNGNLNNGLGSLFDWF